MSASESRLRVLWVALVVLLVGAVALLWSAQRQPWPTPDVAAANDLRERAGQAWDSGLDAATFARPDLRFSVVDSSGTRIHEQNGAPSTALEVAAQGAIVLPVEVEGHQVGVLYFFDDAQQAALGQREARVARTACAVVVIMALGVGSVLVWVELRYLRPFRRMRRFAQDVAGGDLEAPLTMDRANAFGAFTESFDLMRVELAASRHREQEAKEVRSALVAQLNHDLRTPVATIAASAEVLRIGEEDPRRIARLETIVAKTEQITDLTDELSRAGRSEQAVLEVHPQEYSSHELAALVAQSTEHIDVPRPPDALLAFDPGRVRQVLDNIVSNSAKYVGGGAPLRVSWTLGPETLRLGIADAGDGVPEEELPGLLGRGVRGSNAVGHPGEGLGLFTSAQLMERMGGSLSVANLHPGFLVDLEIPMA
ncbi:MAG: ATP-binding protein [Pauljensenia sp.]